MSELENIVKYFYKFLVKSTYKKFPNRLDHIAFFGSADREYAISKYKIIKRRQVLYYLVLTQIFGSYQKFRQMNIFSIGQDPSRDFDTLVNTKKKI